MGGECSLFDNLGITAFGVLFYRSILRSDKQMTIIVVLMANCHLCRALMGMDMHYRQHTRARPVFDTYTTNNSKQDCLCLIKAASLHTLDTQSTILIAVSTHCT